METSEFLLLILILNYLSTPREPIKGHGYYYKNGGERCENPVYFTDGIGLHDGTTGKQVELV